MVYNEGDRSTWMQPCIFKNGKWEPLGRPFVSAIKGSKIKTTTETKKAKLMKETQQAKYDMQVKLDAFSKVEIEEEVL